MLKKNDVFKTFSIYIRVSYSVNSISLNLISEHYKPSSVSRVYTIHIKNISIILCFSSNLWPLENFNRLIAKILYKTRKKGGENCLSSLSSLFISKLHHFVFVRLNANHFVLIIFIKKTKTKRMKIQTSS